MAHPARRALDQHPASLLDAGRLHQGLPGDQRAEGQGRGLDVVKTVGREGQVTRP